MRLFTRADMDGVLCAAMIADMEDIRQIVFAHPNDIENNLIEIKPGDAIANLPFHENAGLWFHRNIKEGVAERAKNVRGKFGAAHSTARLVYQFYSADVNKADILKNKYEEPVDDTDQLNSALLTYEDVLKPEGWILLGFTLDPRTGLGSYQEYSIEIIEALRSAVPLEQILDLPMVKTRIKRYLRDEYNFKKMLMDHTVEYGNISVTDVRNMDEMPIGNRFVVYALFPRCNVNIRMYDHRDATKTMFALGKSLFDHSLPHHIGKLMEQYGGGGLDGAGTCPIYSREADEKLQEIIKKLRAS